MLTKEVTIDFNYDGAIRRYLVQFIRIFSDIKVETGPDDTGTLVQKRVPIIYGDPSWLVAQILKGQTENSMMPSPMMSAWINSLELAPERRQAPDHESKITAAERDWDGSAYGSEIGNRYTVERYMPVPYTLNMQLDIWTTSTTTKLQILEQILMFFNPALQLQSTSNYFDWTSLFEVEMTSITWSNRGIPNGSEAERDVASIQFKLGIWINPPAKVKRIKIIEEIVANLHVTNGLSNKDIDKFIEKPFECIGNPDAQIIVTPGNFKIKIGVDGYASNEVVLLNMYGVEDPSLSWKDLFSTYGNLKDFETILRLKLAEDIEQSDLDILGALTFDENRSNVIFFEIDTDTLPTTTLRAVNKIINPREVYPGSGIPAATSGQRYLLVSNTSNGEEPAMGAGGIWGTAAYPNDIIEYDGTDWVISFDSQSVSDTQYLINLNSINHYRWTGAEWEFTYLGEYSPGYWKLQNLADTDPSDGPIAGPLIVNPPPCTPKTNI